MRNKIKKSLLAFVVLAIILVPSCFAATVLEDAEDYTEGAIIYGSTRFDTDVIITAGEAFNAGINESKVWVALGNKLNDLEPVTPYFYDGASWYKIVNDEENPAVPVTEAEAIKAIEEDLHIFFVNNEMKTVEVPYDGNVDEDSVTDGAKYDKENKKFVVPALSFNFEFTDDGAKVEVNTNVDTNKKEENTGDDIKEPEIINREVAAIGDVKYEDLSKAIEAAKDGDTVKLLADIDIPTGIEVSKKITVNLNGKTLTAKKDTEGNGIFMVVTGGDLTIEGDGKIDSACLTNDYSMAIWVKETGKLTINGGTFTNVGAKDMEDDGKTANNNELIYVRDNGSAVINGGTFIGNTSNKTYGAGFTLNLRDADRATASITVKGGTFTGFNPADNAAENAGTNFVAEGYKVVADGDKYTVKAYDANNVTSEAELRHFIANGTDVKLGADIDLVTGIEVSKKVTVNLNGKTLTAKKDTEGIGIFMVVTGGDLTIEGDGKIDSACLTNDYSMAIWVKETGKLTINGGTFTNVGAKDMEDDGKTANNNELIYVRDDGSAVINGGTFIGNTSNKTYGAGFTLNLRDADRATASITVKGGTFAGFNPADNAAENAGTNFVAEGYKSVYNEADNTYTVVAYDANNVVNETELRYFISKGTDVKLGADIDLVTGIEVNKKVTVNLNGKTLTAKKDTEGIGIFMVVTGGDLTIEGDGKIDSACLTNDYSMAIWVKETGKLTINGGTFTNVGAKDMEDDGKTANNNELIYVRDNGSAVINGGTFIGNTSNKTYGAGFTLNLRDADRATASITVKGGTFTGFNPADNAAENAGTNFVAEGYKSVANGETFVVSAE